MPKIMDEEDNYNEEPNYTSYNYNLPSIKDTWYEPDLEEE
jgi:hypothetical protein